MCMPCCVAGVQTWEQLQAEAQLSRRRRPSSLVLLLALLLRERRLRQLAVYRVIRLLLVRVSLGLR